MKIQKTIFRSLLLMGFFLVLISSCKKNENDNVANPFTDSRDGNIYKTVKIGEQIWMAENLRYLPNVVGPATGSLSTPYYYVYGYNGTNVATAKATANYATYGVLYNWAAARAACPDGWHLPSDDEWFILKEYLGDEDFVGGMLKETGTSHWIFPNTGATNVSGFNALPGGGRYSDGTFIDIGYYGNWWTAYEMLPDGALFRRMYYNSSSINRGDETNKEEGLAVRCVRN